VAVIREKVFDMIKISNYLKQKGQGIVEYAILLAFILGVAVLLQSGGLKDSVVGIFDKAAAVLAGEKESIYAASLEKWGTMPYSALQNESNAARIAADIDGLTNIADFFNSLDKNFDEMAGTYNTEDGYLHHKYPSDINLGENPNNTAKGSVVFTYLSKTNDATESRTYGIGAASWMKQDYTKDYVAQNYNDHKWYNERYYFSNEMNNNSEKQVKVAFTTDSSGNITGTRVWVGGNSSNPLTATDENGKTTAYSVYVPKK